MVIKGFTFDLEGTVVDVEKAHHLGWVKAVNSLGLKMTLEESLNKIEHFIGGPDSKVASDYQKIAQEQGLDIDPKEILKRKKTAYNEVLKEIDVKARDGFKDFITKARTQGYKLAIGSVTSQDQAMYLLEQSGVGELIGYDNIVLREHVQNPKPAPDVWIETAKRMGIQTDEQIIFEDSPRGMQGASKINAQRIGMPIYFHLDKARKALEDKGALAVYESWKDVTVENILNLANGN